jgi:hypothetical protein
MSSRFKYQARRVVPELRDLVWDWDPIGVSDVREDVADEYECLVGPLLSRLTRGETTAEVAAFLTEMLAEHFGLPPERYRPADFARGLTDWYATRKHLFMDS